MRYICISLAWSEAERGPKSSDYVELSDHAEFFRDHAELPPRATQINADLQAATCRNSVNSTNSNTYKGAIAFISLLRLHQHESTRSKYVLSRDL